MPSIKLHGIILRSDDIGESDKAITFLTKDRGKKRAIAKGVKKLSSKRAGHLDLLNRVSLLLHQGKLLTITQSTVEESFHSVKSDVLKLGWAMMLISLTDKLISEDQSEPHYYDFLHQTLQKMDLEPPEHARRIVQDFSLEALHLLGFMPKLERNARTHRALSLSGTPLLEALSLLPNSDDLRDIFQRIH